MKLKLWIALLAAAGLAWSTAAIAAPPGPQRPGMHRAWRGMGMMGMMEALHLTPQQKEQLRTLHLDQAKKMAQLQANLKIARLNLQEVMGQTDPKPAEVKTRVSAVAQASGAILQQKMDGVLAMRKILTPEQFQKLRQLRQRRMRAWGARGRHMMGAWQHSGRDAGQHMRPPEGAPNK